MAGSRELNFKIPEDVDSIQNWFAIFYINIHNYANQYPNDKLDIIINFNESVKRPKDSKDPSVIDPSIIKCYVIFSLFPYLRPKNVNLSFIPGGNFPPLKADPGSSNDLNPEATVQEFERVILTNKLNQNPNVQLDFEEIFEYLYRYRNNREYALTKKPLTKKLKKVKSDEKHEEVKQCSLPTSGLQQTQPGHTTDSLDNKHSSSRNQPTTIPKDTMNVRYTSNSYEHGEVKQYSPPPTSGLQQAQPRYTLDKKHSSSQKPPPTISENPRHVPVLNADKKKLAPEKVHVSLDADLCFLNANFEGSYRQLREAWIGSQWQQGNGKDATPTLEQELEFAVTANKPLTEFLRKEQTDVLHNGSNRQSHAMDKGNSEEQNTARYFPLLEKYTHYVAKEAQKEITLNKDLLCNAFSQTDPKTEYDKENFDSYTIVDNSKVLLFLYQILKIAAAEPNIHHQFKIVDDNKNEVLENFHAFFAIKENRMLIPDNVTVSLYHYDGKKKPEKFKQPIKGEGVVLSNGSEKIKNLFVNFKKAMVGPIPQGADAKYAQAPSTAEILAKIPGKATDASLTFYDRNDVTSKQASKVAVAPLSNEISKKVAAIKQLRAYLRKRRKEEESICTRIGAFFKGIGLKEKTTVVHKMILLLENEDRKEITFSLNELKVLQDARLGVIIKNLDPRILPKAYSQALIQTKQQDDQIKQNCAFVMRKGWAL